MEEKIIKTNVLLPESLWMKSKIRAVTEKVSFTEIVRKALKEYLDKTGPKKGKK